jgi:hypothetical protein
MGKYGQRQLEKPRTVRKDNIKNMKDRPLGKT